jgi:hypothetical protein
MRRILFAAIALAALGAAGYFLGRPGSVPADSPEQNRELPDPMFPDGLEHDFGKVARGEVCKHSFRIVNTSSSQLKVISLRIS